MITNVDVVLICPKCKCVTKYYSNPMYMHICEHCGSTYSYDKLINGCDVDQLTRAIKDIAYCKNKLRHTRKGRMIQKLRKTRSSKEKTK